MAEDRKNQIIEKATELFSRHGYDKVAMKQIAAACGVTEAALYRHFLSKDDIYDNVMESLLTRLQYKELFEKLSREDDLEKILHDIAAFLLDFLGKNDDLYRLMLFSALRGHSKAKKIFARMRGSLIEFVAGQLQRFKDLDLLYDLDPSITARCFVGMIMDCALGLNLWPSLGGKQVTPADAIKNNIPIYARGLLKKR